MPIRVKMLGCLLIVACAASPAAAQMRLAISEEESGGIFARQVKKVSHQSTGFATSPCDASPVYVLGDQCGCDGVLDGGCDSMYDGSCDSMRGCGRGNSTAMQSGLLGLSRNASSASPFFFNSWMAQGFSGNPDDPVNGSNLPVTFNDRANDYLMNQLYISAGKEVQRGDQIDIGGRVDFLYGSDYFFTTSRGLETDSTGAPDWNSSSGPRGSGASIYGIALPQLYAEIYAPIGNGMTFKVGHFYTIIGYESVMAPENFFYSHSYSMQYGQPFTHTGILGSFTTSGGIEVQAGLTQGWDTWDTGEVGFLGSLGWTSSDKKSNLTFAISSGDEDNVNGFAPRSDNRTAFTTVYERKLNSGTTYAFEQVFGVEQNATVIPNGLKSAHWYGINQYLFRDISEKTTAGLRVEWFRDEDNARVLGIPVSSQTSGGNYVGITGGLNFQPSPWLNIRPEIRYDWSDAAAPIFGQQAMFNDFQDDNQLTLSFDAIIRL